METALQIKTSDNNLEYISFSESLHSAFLKFQKRMLKLTLFDHAIEKTSSMDFKIPTINRSLVRITGYPTVLSVIKKGNQSCLHLLGVQNWVFIVKNRDCTPKFSFTTIACNILPVIGCDSKYWKIVMQSRMFKEQSRTSARYGDQ